MLQEDYKQTQEGAHSCLETKKKNLNPNTELTLLSSFLIAAEQQHKQAPRGANTDTDLVHTHAKIHKTYQCYFALLKAEK